MRGVVFFTFWLGVWSAASPALAAPCHGNPQALGTSRTIAITPAEYPKVGTVHYNSSLQLPLADHEVVLTFDDGPLAPYTEQILDALAKECVKATFFMVGRQASAAPDLTRRVYNAGHVIGTHSQNHPLTFDQMSIEAAQREIDDGIVSVAGALGDKRAVAPFFRIPGFLRISAVEDYLASQAITVWSTDVDADDWYKTASPQDIVTKAMTRITQKSRGIILLHDVQPATAQALPLLLTELKTHGFKVVQVAPAGKRVALRDVRTAPDKMAWPRLFRERPESRRPSERRGARWTYGYPPDWR